MSEKVTIQLSPDEARRINTFLRESMSKVNDETRTKTALRKVFNDIEYAKYRNPKYHTGEIIRFEPDADIHIVRDAKDDATYYFSQKTSRFYSFLAKGDWVLFVPKVWKTMRGDTVAIAKRVTPLSGKYGDALDLGLKRGAK